MSETKRIIKHHRQVVKKLIGEGNAKRVFRALKKDIPIMVYERNAQNSIDGLLYRSLKVLGAKKVYNFDSVLEDDKMVHGVYCAIFNVVQS